MAMTAALTAGADNSPYIAHVYDYLPAPGQFVNQSPAYKPGYTQDSINALVEASLCGQANGGTVSLGSFGGYIVFGFAISGASGSGSAGAWAAGSGA